MQAKTNYLWVIVSAVLMVFVGPVLADTTLNGKRMYDTYCVQCHGSKRDGNGINAAHMSVQPRDHTDAESMGDIPDDQLFKAIRNGGLAVDKSVLMPAWKSVLTDDQIRTLVSYLREVCQCGTDHNN